MEYEVEVKLTAKLIVEAEGPLDALAYSEKIPSIQILSDLYDIKKRIGTISPRDWK